MIARINIYLKKIISLLIIVVMFSCQKKLNEEETDNFRKAIVNNDTNYILKVINKGIDLNSNKQIGFLPLLVAIRNNNIELIKFFINKGANVNVTNEWKQNSLFFSCNIDVVKYLVENGANIHQIDIHGWLPMMVCADKTETVKYYIEKGVNYTHKNNVGFSILGLAVSYGNYDLAYYLIKEKKMNSNEVISSGFNLLMLYITSCYLDKKNIDYKFIQLLLNSGIDINHQEKNHNSALHLAVKFTPQKPLIKLLLDKGARKDVKNAKGQTPYDIAVEKGLSRDILQLLK